MSGTVTDLAGNPLSNVRVLLGALFAVTGLDGHYAFENLQEGGYTISLQNSSGDFDCRSIVLAAGQTEYDFVLPNVTPGFRVTSVEPYLGSSGNPLGAPLAMTLSHTVNAASVAPSDFSVVPEIGEFTVETPAGGAGIVLIPRLQLPANQNFTVTVEGDIRDSAGVGLNKPVRWSFRTALADTSPPRLLGVSPAPASTQIALNQRLRFEYNETLAAEQLSLIASAQPEIALSLETDGRFLYVSPVGGWQANTSYTLTLQNVADLAGNTANQATTTSFRTGQQALIARNINGEWNRVGNRIVFASDRSGNFDIWSISPDGSGLQQLTATAQQELEPTLSEDATSLAFQTRAANGLWDIVTAAFTESGLSEPLVITPLDFNDYQPQFSRTPSNQLLFVSTRSSRTGLYLMNEDGSSPTEIDPDFTSSSADPAFHPLLDGQLLFSASTGSDRDIWRKSVSIVDGSVVNTNLTSGRLSDDYSPAWGPDASFIVFISDFSGTPNLWQAEANGEFAQQVTSFSRAASDPCVSPIAGDNTCLLTLAREDGGSDLVIVSLLSGDILHNLTSEDGPDT